MAQKLNLQEINYLKKFFKIDDNMLNKHTKQPIQQPQTQQMFQTQEQNFQLENVLSSLEAEPSSQPDGGIVSSLTAGPNIPALREKLAVLVSSGKTKEAIGVQLTQEQVKRLTDKEVMTYTKRYETYVGSKTTETLIDSTIFLFSKALGMVVKIKDIEAYQKELKTNYIINQELSTLAGSAALKCGRLLALANAALITTKHIDFETPSNREEISEHDSPTIE